MRIAGLLLLAGVCRAQAPRAVVSQASPELLRAHVNFLTTLPAPRSAQHPAMLDSVANYIGRRLQYAGGHWSEQPYRADGVRVRNIIGSFGPAEGPRIIIGAHYDVFGENPGADDNGSGVAALLELARLLGSRQGELPYRVDLVAYTLEEPPYFQTPQMGSYVHAKWLHDNRIPVRGMVCLEMLGYYNDEPQTQKYPLGFLKLFYGTKANYLTLVRRFGGGRFTRQFARRFNRRAKLPVKRFQGPARLPGVDFSDHSSYWAFGFPALLLTDTSFYRYDHYHEVTDTAEKLNYERIGQAVDAVLATLLAK